MNENREDAARRFYGALHAHDLEALRTLGSADPSLLAAYEPDHCCGGTVMNAAVTHGDKELLQTLLDLGGDPNQPSDWPPGPFRALNTIPERYRDELAPWLIERGAELDAHSAAMLGLDKELAAILQADPEGLHRKGPDGQRPLHVARTPEIAAALLDLGADIEAECVDHGSRPAEYAAPERPDVCRLLLDRGARGDEFMYTMIGDIERLDAAIEADPEVLYSRTTPERFAPTDGEAAHMYMYSIGSNATLMHAAVTSSNVGVIRYLAKKGLDPSLRGGYDDQTPTHLAAWGDKVDVIRALWECDANIDLPSGEIHRNEPVGWAIVNGSAGAVETLLGLGAGIRDDHFAQAKAGIAGEFRQWSSADVETFERILEMLGDERRRRQEEKQPRQDE